MSPFCGRRWKPLRRVYPKNKPAHGRTTQESKQRPTLDAATGLPSAGGPCPARLRAAWRVHAPRLLAAFRCLVSCVSAPVSSIRTWLATGCVHGSYARCDVAGAFRHATGSIQSGPCHDDTFASAGSARESPACILVGQRYEPLCLCRVLAPDTIGA